MSGVLELALADLAEHPDSSATRPRSASSLAGPPDWWTYRDGKDRCPRCSNRPEETT